MGDPGRPRIFIGFPQGRRSLGGGQQANLACEGVLRSNFVVAGSIAEADLHVISFAWEAPAEPRRIFVDHGSFADASFWAYTAPRLRASDTILVSSPVCVRVAERCFAAGGPLVLNVPFPVDLERFLPASDRHSLRKEIEGECGLPAGGPLLLVASAFVRRKNQHLAVMFLHALLEQAPAARLAVVGDTPERPASTAYREAVARLADEKGVGSRVHFLGPVPQARLARLMAASDILVHLTNCRLENFGLVVAEAMASGLPVLAADWGGLRDLVVPGETGFLARTFLTRGGPRTDWLSAVPAVAGLLNDPVAWSEMSRRSRSRAERHLGPAEYGERVCAAVRTAFQRPVESPQLAALTAPATEMRFRTIHLNAIHPEIADTGDEYRLLMQVDEGRHYRLLTGPAATSERPPVVEGGQRLYPVVTWTTEGDEVRITDPAWPAILRLDSVQMEVLRRCDGVMALDAILGAMGISPDGRAGALRGVQALVEEGVVCPLGSVAAS